MTGRANNNQRNNENYHDNTTTNPAWEANARLHEKAQLKTTSFLTQDDWDRWRWQGQGLFDHWQEFNAGEGDSTIMTTKQTWKLRASAPTLEGIERMMANHFYTEWKINRDDLSIIPMNGKTLTRYRVIKKKSRYRLEEQQS